MNTENEALGRQVMAAAAQARRRTDAQSIVDAAIQHARLQLGAIDTARNAGGMRSADADAAQADTLRTCLGRMERIAAAPENQLGGILHPPVATQPEPPREHQAHELLESLTAKGVRFYPDHEGRIIAHPASSITEHERQRLTELRVEITAQMRNDLFVIDPKVAA
ncbi:hypothetical protein ABVK25_008771 [Lepraria finkii]|uniref:Uncharacterized protein n=1 Tax=Lepraria finkii TaxID=1340010 RepID=A0ABR4AZW3_9LECA